jgi:Spy/CpxP family protein refolding chaperone
MAQNPGRGHGARVDGESPQEPTYLLASKSVQKELALTREQEASFEKLQSDENSRHPFFSGFAGLTQAQIQQRLEQHAKSNRDRISKILTPQQSGRLNEIHLQLVGAAALNFDEVAKQLELSAEQKAKLRSISADARRKLAELNAANNNRPVDRSKAEEHRQKVAKITGERSSQSLALLTDAQRSQFEKLQGAKFDTSTIKPNARKFTRRGRIEPPGPPRQ